jgi:hypothetical protein
MSPPRSMTATSAAPSPFRSATSGVERMPLGSTSGRTKVPSPRPSRADISSPCWFAVIRSVRPSPFRSMAVRARAASSPDSGPALGRCRRRGPAAPKRHRSCCWRRRGQEAVAVEVARRARGKPAHSEARPPRTSRPAGAQDGHLVGGVIGGGEVRPAVAVEVAGRQRMGPSRPAPVRRAGIARLRYLAAGRRRCQVVGGGQVGATVAVEVGPGKAVGELPARGADLGVERAVAAAGQERDVGGALVGDGQVELAVAVAEIAPTSAPVVPTGNRTGSGRSPRPSIPRRRWVVVGRGGRRG